MNWEAIGSIAEALGAVAVIVSIAYLATQVRQTRLQLKAQAEDVMMSRAFEAYNPVYDGNNAAIFRKGLMTPDLLDEDEAFLFKLLMDRQRGAYGTLVRRIHNGSINTDLSKRMLNGYQQLFLHTKGGQVWLSGARASLSEYELRILEDGI